MLTWVHFFPLRGKGIVLPTGGAILPGEGSPWRGRLYPTHRKGHETRDILPPAKDLVSCEKFTFLQLRWWSVIIRLTVAKCHHSTVFLLPIGKVVGLSVIVSTGVGGVGIADPMSFPGVGMSNCGYTCPPPKKHGPGTLGYGWQYWNAFFAKVCRV